VKSVHVGDVLVVVEFKDGPQADGSDYERRCQAASMNQLQFLKLENSSWNTLYLSDRARNKRKNAKWCGSNRSENDEQSHEQKVISSIVECKSGIVLDDPGNAEADGTKSEKNVSDWKRFWDFRRS